MTCKLHRSMAPKDSPFMNIKSIHFFVSYCCKMPLASFLVIPAANQRRFIPNRNAAGNEDIPPKIVGLQRSLNHG